MKILYIHQYYRTPSDGGAIRSWYISSAMAEAGHEVDLITAHNKRKYEIRINGGVRVHYLPVFYSSSFGFFRRIWAFFHFSIRAYLLGRRLDRPDLMYVSSTPLTVGLTAILLKQYYHRPYFFEVRDIWPEAPVQIGVIRSPLVKLTAGWLEKKACHEARALVALSPGIESHLKKLPHKNPVLMCPNMSDCDFFNLHQEKNPDIIKRYGLEGKFVVGYFGAIGRANALEFLVEAAAMAKSYSRKIAFMIIGEGPSKPALVEKKEAYGLDNLHFAGYQDKYMLRHYLSVIDAAYVSFARLPVFRTSSPNKFFDALASGKMIISNTDGWIKDQIETRGCGFYYDPADPASFLKKIMPVINDPQLLSTMKKNSRRLAESVFERKKLIAELLTFMNI